MHLRKIHGTAGHLTFGHLPGVGSPESNESCSWTCLKHNWSLGMKLSAKLKSPKSPKSLRVLISNCGLLPLTSASLCPQKSWSVPAPISQTSTCDAMELCGEHFLLRSRYKSYKKFLKFHSLPEINLPIHKCLIQQTRVWTIPICAGRGKLSAILSPKPQVPGRTVCCMKKVFTRRLGCKLTFNLKCINWHSQVSNAGACRTATSGAYRVGEGCRAEDGQAAIAQKKQKKWWNLVAPIIDANRITIHIICHMS